MPCHPDRVRTAPLPAGYQFGDADNLSDALKSPSHAENWPKWRPLYENAAERTERYRQQFESREGDATVLSKGWRD